MNTTIELKRTTSNDRDFQMLVSCLDRELWHELSEDQSLYEQFNKVQGVKTVIVLYVDRQPAACGCFKAYDKETVEIKRMYVDKEFRRRGLSITILEELENWAAELGFKYAILETSVHFRPARALYTGSGYHVIENYDQYRGLEESVCMKKKLGDALPAFEFHKRNDIEYFQFEEDFVEKNIRCIPMIVRLKMDKVGIKLKLEEWAKFPTRVRIELARMPCDLPKETSFYQQYLGKLIRKYAHGEPTKIEVDPNPAWQLQFSIPLQVVQKMKEQGGDIAVEQWKELSRLQRFALLKLSRPGHESKNFVKAIREFGILA